jgi:hypothetical protein
MEDLRSFETSVYNKRIWRYIPEDGILSQQLDRGTEETRSINSVKVAGRPSTHQLPRHRIPSSPGCHVQSYVRNLGLTGASVAFLAVSLGGLSFHFGEAPQCHNPQPHM